MSSDAPLDRQPDSALVARYVTVRDEEAFGELVRRHGPMVLCTCARVLRHRQDAEDACQAVFLILAARRRSLRRVRSIGGWLHAVAVRVSYGMLRANRRRQKRLSAVQSEHPVEKDGHVRELEEVLDEELTALPAKYREALILCDLEGHTRGEAARRLNTSASAIAKRITRGRKLLRERLVRRGVTLGAGGLAAALAGCSAAAVALPAGLMQGTVRLAELFLLGNVRGVPEITKITALAQGELNRMFLAKIGKSVCVLALMAAIWFGTPPISEVAGLVADVRANTIFFDDFNDRNATDGTPATWVPLSGSDTGTFSAASGDFVLTQPPDGWPQVAYADIAPVSAISIRAHVRELQGDGPISLMGRVNPVGTPSGYQAGFGRAGLYIVRTDSPFNNTTLASAATNLNPAVEDIILQFDIIGPRLDLFAWRAGDPKPYAPSLSATDSTFATGVPAILIDSAEIAHSVAFRSIHIATTSIPEPSSLALGSLGAVALASLAIRMRLLHVG